MQSSKHYPIHERIKQMNLSEFNDRSLMELIMGNVDEVKNDVKDLQKRLYGNGETGIIEEVHNNTRFRKTAYWIVGVVFAALITVIFETFIGR